MSKYEINIYLKEGSDGTPVSNDQKTGSGGNVKGMSQVGTEPNNKATKALAKYVSSQTLGVFLNNAKSTITSNVALVSGKSELQQKVDFGMQAIQFGTNTFKNAQAGAVLATSAGLSAGMGAAIGAALSVVSFAVDKLFQQVNLNLQANVENGQIAQVRSRAGAYFNRSRSGV